MKFLGIDYGLVRTGIAVTDAGGRMAFPRCVLVSRPQEPKSVFFDALLRAIATENPAALVVGLPLHVDGQEHNTTRQVRNFVQRLQRRLHLPIYLMPEILSSHEAESCLREAGVKSHKMRDKIDQQAAVRILESFLVEKYPERLLV